MNASDQPSDATTEVGAPDAGQGPPTRRGPGLETWVLGVAGAALILPLYQEALQWLWVWWKKDPFYSFGPLVPLVSAYVIWERRQEYLAQPARPAAGAGWVVAGALLLHVMALWWDVNSVSCWSFLLLVGGLMLAFQGSGRLKVLSFPYLFLFLAVPIPSVPLEVLSLPLQLLSARLAAAAGNAFLGLGMAREGTILKVAEYTFAVEAECSGLKNIISLFTLSILMAGLWTGQALWKRLLLVFISPVIAVIANAARIVVIVCIGKAFGPEAADSFFHEASGIIVFGVALVAILVWMEGMRRIEGILLARSSAA